MVGDTGKSNPPRPKLDDEQLDDEQDVERLEAHGLHREEVGGHDAGGLGTKEGPQVTEVRRGAGRSPLRSSTVRMVVADTWTPSFLSSPWMRR